MSARIVRTAFAGTKWGRLTAIREMHKNERGEWIWEFKCDCGNMLEAPPYRVKSGNTNSCGCFHRDQTSEARSTHKLSRTPTYILWASIKKRCFNRNCRAFPDYGGRGIVMCEEWRNSFEAFAKALGVKPFADATIERINNDRNYEPGNIRWATRAEQNRNKRNSHIISAFGLTMTVAEWGERTGLDMGTILQRKHRGWSDEDAVSKPLQSKGNCQPRNPKTVATIN